MTTTPFAPFDRTAGLPIPVLALHSRHQHLDCCPNPDINAVQSIGKTTPGGPQRIATSHDCQNCYTTTSITTITTHINLTDLVTRPNTRPPSPADERNNLDPSTVDTFAHELHLLRCISLSGTDLYSDDPHHHDADRASARFLLIGLQQHGYTLTHTNP
jgi:hypothetical protein